MTMNSIAVFFFQMMIISMKETSAVVKQCIGRDSVVNICKNSKQSMMTTVFIETAFVPKNKKNTCTCIISPVFSNSNVSLTYRKLPSRSRDVHFKLHENVLNRTTPTVTTILHDTNELTLETSSDFNITDVCVVLSSTGPTVTKTKFNISCKNPQTDIGKSMNMTTLQSILFKNPNGELTTRSSSKLKSNNDHEGSPYIGYNTRLSRFSTVPIDNEKCQNKSCKMSTSDTTESTETSTIHLTSESKPTFVSDTNPAVKNPEVSFESSMSEEEKSTKTSPGPTAASFADNDINTDDVEERDPGFNDFESKCMNKSCKMSTTDEPGSTETRTRPSSLLLIPTFDRDNEKSETIISTVESPKTSFDRPKSDNEKSTTKNSGSKTTVSKADNDADGVEDSDPGMTVTGAVSAAVILILLIFIVILVCKLRKATQRNKQNSERTFKKENVIATKVKSNESEYYMTENAMYNVFEPTMAMTYSSFCSQENTNVQYIQSIDENDDNPTAAVYDLIQESPTDICQPKIFERTYANNINETQRINDTAEYSEIENVEEVDTSTSGL